MTLSKTKLWHLENINVFKDIPMPVLQEIGKKTIDRTIDKDQYIYFPDDPSTSIYFLKTGRIKIGSYSDDGKEITKAILYPGEIFGELALVGDETRNDFTQAMDKDVLICAMGMEDMMEIMMKNPKLNYSLLKLIGLRVKRIERRFESLVFKDARTRLIDLMKELAEDIGKPLASGISVKHNLTHQDIANLTAISRQKVTTILNELKEEKLIHLERKSFIIHDIKKLI